MTLRTRTRRHPVGQALVEFALVAPMFFLLLFAILEGARFVFYNEMLNNAAREGARYAIVHGSQAIDGCPSGPMAGGNPCDEPGDNVIDAASDAAIGLVNSGDIHVYEPVWSNTTTLPTPGDASTGDNKRGNYVTVFIDYTYSPLVPILPSITISARSTLVINN